MKITSTLIPLVAAALIFSGCAMTASRCAPGESAGLFESGMELLERNKVGAAESSLARATLCDWGYSPAQGGLAVVYALKAARGPAGGVAESYEAAFEHLKKASVYSGADEEFVYRIASMRVLTVLKPSQGWLSGVEEEYRNAMRLKVADGALPFYEGREAATYYMGLAYLETDNVPAALDRFEHILGQKKTGRWSDAARARLKMAEKKARAASGGGVGEIGKLISRMETVRRVDLAVLLVDELKIDSILLSRLEDGRTEPLREAVPVDMEESPFRQEAEVLLKWKIKGMEPLYDTRSKTVLFMPDEPVKRKVLASMIEDIIIKATGNDALARAYMGRARSPFTDVDPASPWFNAVMSVTSRGLMETESPGEFRPDEVVTGAEAVIAIKALKKNLNVD